MKVITAPGFYGDKGNRHRVFLAGSIEQGKAVDWQSVLAAKLIDLNVQFLNPRRKAWDSSWPQDPTPGTPFNQQVTWELNGIESSDLVVFYFDPKTTSPITLLELGLCLGKGIPVVVYCPPNYFRYGNVRITMRMNGAESRLYTEFDPFVSHIRDILERKILQ